MAKNPHLELTNRILVCREYADLWQTYFQFIGEDGLHEKEFTEEEEEEFQNILSLLSVNHYKFEQLCGPDMGSAGAVLKIIAETPSLEVVQKTPEATYGRLLVDWHIAFIDMNKALGRMLGRMTPKQMQKLQEIEAAQESGAAQQML